MSPSLAVRGVTQRLPLGKTSLCHTQIAPNWLQYREGVRYSTEGLRYREGLGLRGRQMRAWETRNAFRTEELESVSNRVGLQGAACQLCVVFEVQGRIITAAARVERTANNSMGVLGCVRKNQRGLAISVIIVFLL